MKLIHNTALFNRKSWRDRFAGAIVGVIPDLSKVVSQWRSGYPAVLGAVLACAVMLLTTASAWATTYTVNSNADTNTGTGTMGTLRYAIAQATDGDTIIFASNVIGIIALTNGSLTISHSAVRLYAEHLLRSLPVLPAMFFWLPGTERAFENRARAKRTRKRRPHAMLWLIALGSGGVNQSANVTLTIQ